MLIENRLGSADPDSYDGLYLAETPAPQSVLEFETSLAAFISVFVAMARFTVSLSDLERIISGASLISFAFFSFLLHLHLSRFIWQLDLKRLLRINMWMGRTAPSG